MKPIVRVEFYGCSFNVERSFVAHCIRASRAASVGRATRKTSQKYSDDSHTKVCATYVKIIADASVDRIRFCYTK